MFTPLALVLAAAVQEPSQQELLDLAGSGRGVLVVWSESVAGGSRVLLAHLDPRGELSEEPRLLSAEPGSFDDHEPALAIGPQGHGALAWCRTVEGKHEIRLRTIAPDAALLDRDVVVARHAAYHRPAVAVDADGEVLVAWLELDMVMAARLAADGSVLDAPHHVTSGGIPALGRPVVVYAQDWLQEIAHIHFEIGEGRGWTLAVERDPFGTQRIEPNGLEGQWGGAQVDTWFGEGRREHVLASEYQDFSEYRLVSGESGSSLIAVLGTLDVPPGRLVHRFDTGNDRPIQFRFHESQGSRFDVLFDGPDGPSVQRYELEADARGFEFELSDGVWEHPVRLAGPVVEGPRFAASRDGSIVAWTETIQGRKQVRYRLVNDAGEMGETQSLDARPLPEPADDQGVLQIAGARGQGFAALWSETKDAATRLLFARLDAQGELREAARELSASAAGADDHEPALALGPQGHGALAWCRDVNGKHEIRVRTFAPDGELLAQDVVVAAHAAYRLPNVAVDEDGEVLVAWLELGMPMAARLAADGALLDAPHRVPWNGLPALVRPLVLFAQDAMLEVARIHLKTGEGRSWTVSAETEIPIPGPGRVRTGELESLWRGTDLAGWLTEATGEVAASFEVEAREEHQVYRNEQGVRLQCIYGTTDWPPDWFDHWIDLDESERLQICPIVEPFYKHYISARSFYFLRSGPSGSALQRHDVEDDLTAFEPDAAWTVLLASPSAGLQPQIASDGAVLLLAWREPTEGDDPVRFRIANGRGQVGDVRTLTALPAPEPPVDQALLQLTAAPGQGFAALWRETVGERTRLLFGRLDAEGALREPARELSAAPDASDRDATIALGVGGHGALAWCREVEEGHAVLLRTFSPEGNPSERDVLLAVHPNARLPGLAVERGGEVLAAWLDGGALHAARLAADGGFLDSPLLLHRAGPPVVERPLVAYSTGSWGQSVELHARTEVGRALSIFAREEKFAFVIAPGDLHRRLREYDASSNVDHEGRHVEACFGFDGDAYHRLVRSEVGVQVVMRSNIRSMHPAWIDHLVSEDPDFQVEYWPGCERPQGYSYVVGLFLLRSELAGRTLQRYGVEEVPNSFGFAFGPPVWEQALRPFADRTAPVLDPALAADGLNVVLAWNEAHDGHGVVFTRSVNADGELSAVSRLTSE